MTDGLLHVAHLTPFWLKVKLKLLLPGMDMYINLL